MIVTPLVLFIAIFLEAKVNIYHLVSFLPVSSYVGNNKFQFLKVIFKETLSKRVQN